MRLHAESMRAYCVTHRRDNGRCGGTMGKFRLHSLSGRRDRPRARCPGKCPWEDRTKTAPSYAFI